VIAAHDARVSGICFSNDCQSIFSSSWDASIKQWSLKDNSLVKIFEGHSSSCFCIVLFNDDKSIISGSKELIMHNVVNGSIIKKFEGHSDYISSLALSANNSILVSGSYDC